MANEIQVARQVSGKTLYAAVRNRAADVWDDVGQAFVVITTVSWDDAKISLSEQGATGDYYGTFPAAIAAGAYSVEVFEEIDGTRKGDQLLGTEHIIWVGDRYYYAEDLLAELVGDDAGQGVARLTANALELGPAGVGGDVASTAQRMPERFVWLLGRRSEGILARNKIAVGPMHDTAFAMDFRNWLGGAQLDTIDAVEDADGGSDLTITPGSIVYEEARCRVTGGVAGAEYRLRFRVTTDQGNTLEADGIISVT